MQHFIFTPGQWIGEGRIMFSTSLNHLRFFTKWTIEPLEKQVITAKQQIEIEGGGEQSTNRFLFSNISKGAFQVELLQSYAGSAYGKGIMDEKTIAWEFRDNPELQGFEVYELQENGDYMLHAEYMSTEELRTIIDGRIWLRQTEVAKEKEQGP
jgi:hypothetical protein